MNLPVQTDERQPQQHVQVPDEWFVTNQEKTQETDSVKRPSLSYAQDAWRRLKKNKLAMAGLFILLFLFVMAAVGPFLSPHSVARQSLTEQNLPLLQIIGSVQMSLAGMCLHEHGTERGFRYLSE